MVRFSLGEDSSDDDAAVIAKAPPTRFLKNKPESPPIVRQPPPCRLRQCALELQLLRDREAQKRSEKKLAPFRARISPGRRRLTARRPKRAFQALALADKAALEVKERQDADIRRDMERARREAALRHAASEKRWEATQTEPPEGGRGRGEAPARGASSTGIAGGLGRPREFGGVGRAEGRGPLDDKTREACVAAILKHLSSARKATTEEAFTDARRG